MQVQVSITCLFLYESVHLNICPHTLYVLSVNMHTSAFVLGFFYQRMHAQVLHFPVMLSILASMLVYVLRSSAWIQWFTHSSTYLLVHVLVRCECVCVYWPWPAAPAGAPWWPQGSCPAGSAAHTQSEPTSLLCPFLPAATHTPGIHTCTYTLTHKHAHACTHLFMCTHKQRGHTLHTHTHRTERGWQR